jgi:orotidine-5'-phosphate decarboxylase
VNARDHLIVALDVPDAPSALALVDRLEGRAGMLKVGKQLFTAAGPALVRTLVERGERVFLDLKWHDIPNTVAGAAAAGGALGVHLLNVHALGGRRMIEAAAEALRPHPEASLLAVTILTSHDEGSLEELGLRGPVADAVVRLALLAQRAGARGVVASPLEIASIREACGPDFLVVTPGIRPAGSASDDQARLATPAAAIAAGASHLVVGRPITGATSPARAAEDVVAEIAAALARSGQ